jgi:hypothetical protein
LTSARTHGKLKIANTAARLKSAEVVFKMNRLSEEAAAMLARNAARSRFAEEIYESSPPLQGPTCENCGQTVDRVTLVPKFEYLGCDDCMVEALRQIVREAGGTEQEIAAVFPPTKAAA